MKQINLSYEGYLTEQKLSEIMWDFCQQIGLDTPILQFKLDRFKVDVVIKIDNKMYAIEFDGYRHYNQAKTIHRDINKSIDWYKKYNTYLIRIPYFVQLTTQSFIHYFSEILLHINETNNIEILIDQNYSHGFVDKQALLPCDFNQIGNQRFLYDLAQLPDNIFQEIIGSLNLYHCDNLLNVSDLFVLQYAFPQDKNIKEFSKAFKKGGLFNIVSGGHFLSCRE